MVTLFTPPPNASEIKAYLPDFREMFFVWGSTIYNPNSVRIDETLMRRAEKYEELQSEYGTKNWSRKIVYNVLPAKYRIRRWWERYLRSYSFRLSQDLPAYQVQLWKAKETTKSKYKLEKIAKELGKELAGGDLRV